MRRPFLADQLQTMQLPYEACINLVKRALQAHAQLPLLVDSAVRLLRYLQGIGVEAVFLYMGTSGIHQTLVQICKDYLKDRAVLENALHVICGMLVYEGNRQYANCPFQVSIDFIADCWRCNWHKRPFVVMQNCTEAVLGAMNCADYTEDEHIQALGATVLRNLACIRDDDASSLKLSPAQLVAAAGAASALEAAMEKHPNSASVQENGRCALYNLLLIGNNDAKATLERANQTIAVLQHRVASPTRGLHTSSLRSASAHTEIEAFMPVSVASQQPSPRNIPPVGAAASTPRPPVVATAAHVPDWQTTTLVTPEEVAIEVRSSHAATPLPLDHSSNWRRQFTPAFWLVLLLLVAAIAAAIAGFVR
jgi:hypothetical protein